MIQTRESVKFDRASANEKKHPNGGKGEKRDSKHPLFYVVGFIMNKPKWKVHSIGREVWKFKTDDPGVTWVFLQKNRLFVLPLILY